jgi:dephospho-CoA kinase
VDNSVKKPIIGILGGVASGKSTVATEFAGLGCKVIDADEIAHQLLDEQPTKDKVISVFGDAILGSGGRIDRGKLGDIVFADAEKLSVLNSILHPLVLARVEQFIDRYNRQAQIKAIVLDMPLLAEVGWAERCDRLIFIDCEQRIRADRAKKMGIFPKNQLKVRENLQIPIDDKARLADNTIDNNSGLSELARQVTEIFSGIVNDG